MIEQYFAPKTREELIEYLGKMTPNSRFISGGTDLILKLNAGKTRPDTLLYLGALPEGGEISEQNGEIHIGAMADMTTIAKNPLVTRTCMALADAAGHVGSVQIRNKATVGGNVANASPAGDLTVPLWLMDAKVHIAGPQGIRTATMDETVVGIEKTSLNYDEAILSFSYPVPPASTYTAYRKLGSRSEVTISRVGLAVLIQIQEGAVQTAKIVLGAVAATPVRALSAERCLEGSRLEPETVEKAASALSEYILEINKRPNRFYKAHASKGVLLDVLDTIRQRSGITLP
ncbi:MAG: FAD binding domain-containing protein [Oscillibacter sp.]|nr:FAD binding domain-containing protein [Oscillibacter sp.]